MSDLSEFKHPITVLSSGVTGCNIFVDKYIKPELIRTLLKHSQQNLSEMNKCFFLLKSDPICPPCWFAINGMWLILLLIGALMCIVKYITMSQLENTGAIHHFNWYSPQTTWAHHIPSVISERSFFMYLFECTQWLFCCLYYVCTLNLCILCAVGWLRMTIWLLIINHTSPLMPILSVYWMVMCYGMQIQATPYILFKQSHLIRHSWVQAGNMLLIQAWSVRQD